MINLADSPFRYNRNVYFPPEGQATPVATTIAGPVFCSILPHPVDTTIAIAWVTPDPVEADAGDPTIHVQAQMAPLARRIAPQHHTARTWQPQQLAAARATRYPDQSFRDAMLAAIGFAPAQIVGDGKIHRFSTHPKRKRDDSGWYIFYDDQFPAGAFGDYRTGERQTWHVNGAARKLTPADRAAIAERQAARERERAADHARAAREARAIWDSGKPANSNHPYLVEKGIAPHGVREGEDGKLLVPVMSADGTLMSLQTIDKDGDKLFLKDGEVEGGFYLIGEPGDSIGIAEGFATAVTAHDLKKCAVVAAFFSGNLLPVARAVRAKYPTKTIFFAADDDFETERERGFNPGLRDARKAAKDIGATVAIPPFDRDAGERTSDWNDFAAARGHDAAKAAFDAAMRAPIEIQGNGLDTDANEPFLTGHENDKERTKPKFPLVAWQDIAFDLDEEWSVEGVFPRVGLACLYGLPSSIKSFVLMDLFKCLAAGGQWGGREVKQGPVVYIAAEGQNGVKKRITGMKKVRKDLDLPNDLPFHLITRAPNFGTSEADRQDLIRDIEAMNVRPIAIGIDTLAQSLGGGDENGTGMVQLIANAGVLIEHFQCLVFLIHHVPIADAERLRGKTDFSGALDVAVLAQRTKGALLTTLTIKKSKDENQELSFTVALVRVVIGTRRSGSEVSTLVVESITEAAGTEAKSQAQQKRIPPQMNMLVSVVQQAMAETEAALIRPFANGPLIKAVKDQVVRHRYYLRIAETGEDEQDEGNQKRLADRRRKAFNNAVKGALEREILMACNQGGDRYLWVKGGA